MPYLVEKIKCFPLKANSFRNTATYRQLWGGFNQLVPRWRYKFASRPRVEKKKVILFNIVGESFEIPPFPVSGIYKCASLYTLKLVIR